MNLIGRSFGLLVSEPGRYAPTFVEADAYLVEGSQHQTDLDGTFTRGTDRTSFSSINELVSKAQWQSDVSQRFVQRIQGLLQQR